MAISRHKALLLFSACFVVLTLYCHLLFRLHVMCFTHAFDSSQTELLLVGALAEPRLCNHLPASYVQRCIYRADTS